MFRKNQNNLHKYGFTLIELLVVIAIIALLVSILVPSLQKAKELARSVVCQTNVRGISLSMRMRVDDNDGYGPYYFEGYTARPFWHQRLMDDGYLEDYRILDCPAAFDEKITHGEGNKGLVYGPNVNLVGLSGTSNAEYFPAQNIDNVGNHSEKLMIVEGFEPLFTGFTRDNAEDPWSIIFEYLTDRHDGEANVSFVDGHIEKGKDKFDENVAAIYRYWRPE